MLIGGLRVLLRAAGVFLSLGMVALAVMLRGGTVGLGGVVVMFGCLVVLVFSHFMGLVGYSLPAIDQTATSRIVPIPNSYC